MDFIINAKDHNMNKTLNDVFSLPESWELCLIRSNLPDLYLFVYSEIKQEWQMYLKLNERQVGQVAGMT